MPGSTYRGRVLRTARRLRLAVEASLALAAGRLLSLLPYRCGARVLGRLDRGGVASPDRRDGGAGGQMGPVADVRWAVAAAARRVPWKALCLQQAYAGVLMLTVRRVPSTTVVGVRRAPGDGGLATHAWTEAGGGIVTGGPGHRQFQPLAVYHRPGSRRR
jgi:hypothetical protein